MSAFSNHYFSAYSSDEIISSSWLSMGESFKLQQLKSDFSKFYGGPNFWQLRLYLLLQIMEQSDKQVRN